MQQGIEKSVLILSGLLLAVGFYITGLQCFWSDSEVWHMKISILQGDARAPFDYWIKPLFLIVLSGIYHLSEWLGVPHPDFGRWIFGLNGLLILCLGSQIVSYFHSEFRIKGIYFLLLGSSWIFLERGFRIRSDLLALSLFLVFLWVVIDGAKGLQFSRGRLGAVFGLFVLSVLVTPKSLLLFMCFLPFLYKIFLTQSLSLRNKVINLVLLCLAAFAGTSLLSESFFISLIRQKTYLQGSLMDAHGEIGIFNAYRWEHVVHFIYENPLICLPLVAKIFWILKNHKIWWGDGIWRSLDIGFLLLLPVLVLFPNRTPFFICSLAPLFMLFAFTGTEAWRVDFSHALSRFQKYIFIIIALSMVAGAYKMKNIILSHNNLEQKQLYEVLKAFSLSYPQKTIYDPAGLSPSPQALHYYLGPGDLESNRASALLISQVQPDIILAGQRILWTKPYLKQEFWKQYKDFSGHGVFQKGQIFESFKTHGKSRIVGYHQIEMKELTQALAHRGASILNPIWLLPLTNEGNGIPDVIFELEDGTGVTQTYKGLRPELVRKTHRVHFPEAMSHLLVFERIPFLLNQFQMSELLRYDPEL